ncbi:MAG: hypothetical protein K2N48_09820 [Muribaculaceae bacterium]|nr:hypothetical protein [Muribaculaceae bacterium]
MYKRSEFHLIKERLGATCFTTSEHKEVPRMKVYSTNDAALWSLDAIYMQEVIPQD